MDRALAVRATSNEAEADELVEEAFKDGRIFVCTGGPGTGKTTVAQSCVHRTLELGGQVLLAYPTNRQASRIRAKLPDEVQVDTYHAAFGLDEEPGTMAAALAQYALVVVDEDAAATFRACGQIVDPSRQRTSRAEMSCKCVVTERKGLGTAPCGNVWSSE